MTGLDDRKPLLAAAGALLLATLLASLAGGRLDGPRLTNLAVTGSPIPAVYLQLDPGEPDRCFVSDRQGSTLRRSDDPERRRAWSCHRSRDERATGNLARWFLRSKRKGSVVLVPVNAVEDWLYPYLYGFVREQAAEAELPLLAWHRLFVDRIYHGLYLRLDLPAPGSREGEDPLHTEFLSVADGALGCVDDRLSIPCRAFPALVADGRLPMMTAPAPLVAWLIARSPVAERLVRMEAQEPFRADWVPLGVSLRDSFRQVRGRDLPLTRDARWSRLADLAELPKDPGEAAASALQAGLPTYRKHFVEALVVHCELDQCAGALSAQLARRLDEPAYALLGDSSPGDARR